MAAIVGKVHVAVAQCTDNCAFSLALTFSHAQRHSPGTVLNIRVLSQHLDKAAKARVSLLERLDKVDKLLNGGHKDTYIESKNGQFAHIQRTRGHKVAAAHKRGVI
ncbi:hypothetical protein SDC9_205593 [bioreactor metagenome]|uniref:Uncharacterized protein n=1 Tax=bioreactor metagenome TaxID=1076179 RepID=A0A645J3C1_9ZZZZ